MVTKSKLKMALVSDQQVDFKKEHQKKMAKKARKENKTKKPTAVEQEESGDEDDEEEDEEGIRELMELDEEESGDEHRPTQVRCAKSITQLILIISRLITQALTTAIPPARAASKITMALTMMTCQMKKISLSLTSRISMTKRKKI